MEIRDVCLHCNPDGTPPRKIKRGFLLDIIQIDFEKEEIWLLGNCPYCKRFARISINTLVKEVEEDA